MKKLFLGVCFLLSYSVAASASTLFVRQGATGNGSGTDWTNALPTLPTNLIRGNIYYIAAGSSGSHTFNDAGSGTPLITLKKATIADHGTATGWSDSFATGPATFTHWNIYTDYYTFDGQTRNSDWEL